MRIGKALLLATVALLLVLIAVQAFALSGDNTGTGCALSRRRWTSS